MLVKLLYGRSSEEEELNINDIIIFERDNGVRVIMMITSFDGDNIFGISCGLTIGCKSNQVIGYDNENKRKKKSK